MILDLKSAAEKVSDQASLLKFLTMLAADWEDSERSELASPSLAYSTAEGRWENNTIGPFLEAAAAWGNDTSKDTAASENIWCRVAHILAAGVVYE